MFFSVFFFSVEKLFLFEKIISIIIIISLLHYFDCFYTHILVTEALTLRRNPSWADTDSSGLKC